MGVVYEAEQLSLHRRVALKVLPFAAVMDPRHLQRFRSEALAAAALDHPHVVKVYGVGQDRGVHFIAMQFIDGRPLSELIRERRGELTRSAGTADQAPTQSLTADVTPTPTAAPGTPSSRTPVDAAYARRVAEWGIQAAEALEHAHALGIVHRDVKPSNLLVDGRGELFVADFGLARVGGDPGLTGTNDLLGTPRYMSPEQAAARHGLVDHRSDVYSLGATLYELLALSPAVAGDDWAAVLKRIGDTDPTPLRARDRHIPRDLETVVFKCLEKDPGRRYQTAKELADDLRRFKEDQPVQAKRLTLRGRAVRRIRRRPLTTAVAALALGLLGGAAWAFERERSHAESTALTVSRQAADLYAAGRLYEAVAVADRAVDLLPRFGARAAVRTEVAGRADDLNLLRRLEDARTEASMASRHDQAKYALVQDTRKARDMYREAFLAAGVDVLGGDAEAVATALRERSARADIAGMLVHWGTIEEDPATRARIEEVIPLIDPGVGQFAARTRRVQAEIDKSWPLRDTGPEGAHRWAAVVADSRKLSADAERANLPPALMSSIADGVLSDDGERILRLTLIKHPGDLWLNLDLCRKLSNSGRASEAVGFGRAAVAVRPQSPHAWETLGSALRNCQSFHDAVAAYRRAVALRPDSAWYHHNFANALLLNKQRAEAEAEFRRAIELNPTDHNHRTNLAGVLADAGRFGEAEAEIRRALEFRPTQEATVASLADLYFRQERWADAEAWFRKAIEGMLATDLGKFSPKGAYSEFLSECHFNLGLTLAQMERLRDAEDQYRQAIKVNPNRADALVNMGAILLKTDRLTEAVPLYQKAFEIARRNPDKWVVPVFEKNLRAVKSQVEYDSRLQAVVAGRPDPAEGEITVFLADYCLEEKKLPALAARLFARGFAVNPRMATAFHQYRYNAACAAALAGCGQSDGKALTEPERTKLREQAHAWLTADLSAWDAERGPDALKTLQHWRADPDLVGIRQDADIRNLPEAEQERWRKLWYNVGQLQRRLEAGDTAPRATRPVETGPLPRLVGQ
jgi:tetratricopeptide (TPR) repeat protein